MAAPGQLERISARASAGVQHQPTFRQVFFQEMQGRIQFQVVIGVFDQSPPFVADLRSVKLFNQGF